MSEHQKLSSAVAKPTAGRFAGLGGRVKPDGTYPTRDEWVKNPAKKDEVVFHDNREVDEFFKDEVAKMDAIVEASGATRESLISNVFRIADQRPDLVDAVYFNGRQARRTDGHYIAPALLEREVVPPTFSMTLEVNSREYPKLLVTKVDVQDHVIRGLAMPHSLIATFGRDKHISIAWIPGGLGYTAISVLKPGADNDTKPTQLNGLYHSADPEAIAQTIDFATEMTAELFRPPNQTPNAA